MSSLDDVFVEDDPDEDRLAEILDGRVKIIPEKEEIRPGENFDELDAEQKIICCLAAVRAMELKGVRETGKIGPRDLAKICPVPQGTIGSQIKDIDVLENDNGSHYLPGYELERAKEIVEGETE